MTEKLTNNVFIQTFSWNNPLTLSQRNSQKVTANSMQGKRISTQVSMHKAPIPFAKNSKTGLFRKPPIVSVGRVSLNKFNRINTQLRA
jgi:hypothetical protein